MSDIASAALDVRPAGLPRAIKVALRYGVSASGPAAVSAAHFLAALIFVRILPASEFGIFSFALILASFGMSISGALLVIPVSSSLKAEGRPDPAIAATCLKMNLIFMLGLGICVFASLLFCGASAMSAFLFGGFGAALAYRWFARCFAYVKGGVGAAVASDLIYSLGVIAGLSALAAFGRVTLDHGAEILLLGSLAGLAPFGYGFFRDQLRALRDGALADYAILWRDLARWSLLGVVFTEMTVNAHAYLVTFISGPKAFALLALGMLFMRPASLIQSALPDMERPIMTRALAAGKIDHLMRTVREFGYGLGAVWIGTTALAAGLLYWLPQIILKKGYDAKSVAMVVLLCAVIMLVRTVRTPLAVWLQAAGEFKALANIGTKSSVLSIGATLILLLAFGPVTSLLGIILGELVILAYLFHLTAAWKRQHA